MSKIPGLSSIPLLGKLFQSQTRRQENSELLVLVTPELVRPIKAGQPVPELSWKEPFMNQISPSVQQPGVDKTGPPAELNVAPMPYEEMLEQMKKEATTAARTGLPMSLAPAIQPATSEQPPAQNPAPAAAPAPAPTKP